MKEVIKEAVDLLRKDKPCVLATVVRTKGSTPQKPGAMLLVKEDGTGVGTLGGGCVEGDIWFAAREMLRNNAGPEFKEYFLNEDIAARDGLVCGGTMYFYLEPMTNAKVFDDIGQKVIDAYEGGEPVALATVVADGSDAGFLGSKLLLSVDGTVNGSLGSVSLDERAIEIAKRVADLGAIESFVTDEGLEVFIEGFTTPPTLIMVGGGHVGKATADLAHNLGYSVHVVDDRSEFSNSDRFPYANETIVTGYQDWSKQIKINVNTFIVVATRGHRFDDLALESALDTPARYIGLLGSRRKTLMIYQRLLSQGISVDRLKDVKSPIGLDIGALTPEEIAVSIMSEIIMERRGGQGSPLQMGEWYLNRASDIVDQSINV